MQFPERWPRSRRLTSRSIRGSLSNHYVSAENSEARTAIDEIRQDNPAQCTAAHRYGLAFTGGCKAAVSRTVCGGDPRRGQQCGVEPLPARVAAGRRSNRRGRAANLWTRIREFTPEFLERRPDGVVLRVSSTIDGVAGAMEGIADPFITRLTAGVSYACTFLLVDAGPRRLLYSGALADERGIPTVVEYAPNAIPGRNKNCGIVAEEPGHQNAFDMMKEGQAGCSTHTTC